MKNISKSGFTAVEVVLVVIVLAIIGLLGYTFYNTMTGEQKVTESSNQDAAADDVAEAPAISSADDLDAALQTLDDTDIEGSSDRDASQLDESSNF